MVKANKTSVGLKKKELYLRRTSSNSTVRVKRSLGRLSTPLACEDCEQLPTRWGIGEKKNRGAYLFFPWTELNLSLLPILHLGACSQPVHRLRPQGGRDLTNRSIENFRESCHLSI